jgi:tetratricopeptide (TPR) repeat protein
MEKTIKAITIILIMHFLVGWHWFEPAAKKNQAGISAYREKKYDEALKQFLSAKGIKPDLPELKNNTAASLYQLKKYKEALEEFSKINAEKAAVPKSDLYYNLGNSFFRLDQFDKALAYYKKSLLENAEDIQAKKNFELTLKKLQQQQDKQDQNKDQNQDQKQDQNQQNKDKNKDQEKQDQMQQKQQKHQPILQYLDQKEKNQMKDKKRAIGIARKEKDW